MAQGGGSEMAPGASHLRLLDKAENLYRSGHWERAYFIYVNELAAIGDKYAQYMAGYMCVHGKGMRPDPVKASAWYRLAAERGAPEFVEVRDELLASMSDEERQQSDHAYVELRHRYSDLALALGHLEDERRLVKSGSTGTNLNTASGPMTIVDPRSGTPMTREEYIGRIENRMQVRLDFITSKMGVERLDATMDDREFQLFSGRVMDYLEVIDDR